MPAYACTGNIGYARKQHDLSGSKIEDSFSFTTLEKITFCPNMTKITAADHPVGGCYDPFDKLELTVLVNLQIQ